MSQVEEQMKEISKMSEWLYMASEEAIDEWFKTVMKHDPSETHVSGITYSTWIDLINDELKKRWYPLKPERFNNATKIPIKNCPFCGSSPIMHLYPNDEGPKTCSIGCNNKLGLCNVVGPRKKSYEEAVRSWNSRSDDVVSPDIDKTRHYHIITIDPFGNVDARFFWHYGIAKELFDSFIKSAENPSSVDVRVDGPSVTAFVDRFTFQMKTCICSNCLAKKEKDERKRNN
jgi:Restriction alleviation protein Lar